MSIYGWTGYMMRSHFGKTAWRLAERQSANRGGKSSWIKTADSVWRRICQILRKKSFGLQILVQGRFQGAGALRINAN